MFGTFDDNGDGRLNLDEFPNALSLIGVHPSNDDLKDLLRLFDTQGKVLLVHVVKYCQEKNDVRSRLDS